MENEFIVFLGLLFNEEEETILLEHSLTGLQGAANNFQWALIRGLEKNLKHSVAIISSLPIGPYPRYYKKLMIKTKSEERSGNFYIQLGFLNVPVIKQITRTKKVYDYIKNMLQKHSRIKVICYSLYDPYIEALCKLKKQYPNQISVCLIVPDMPGKLGAKPSRWFDRLIFGIRGNRLLKISNGFDWYVLLTEQMKYPLKIESKPYEVIEGIAEAKELLEINKSEGTQEKIILFTGTLHRRFGIKRLIDAFEMIEGDEYRLILCGTGDMEDYIKGLCETDNRILFKGYVSKKVVNQLQSECTVLVNPRIEEEEYVRYSFPSKTMEYLLSGKPVIMNKLSGVPDEYYEYIISPMDNSAEALAYSLKHVCNLSKQEQSEIGLLGRKFVIENKTAVLQANRVLNLMKRREKE